MLTRFREGFYSTERPMLTNEDLTNFYPNGSAPVRTTVNARIFLDWMKTKLGAGYNEQMFRRNIGTAYEIQFKKDVTPLVNAIKSLDKKPTPTEFINKLKPLLPSSMNFFSKESLVQLMNDPNMNDLNLAYEYLFGKPTEKAKVEETPTTTTTPAATTTTTPATTTTTPTTTTTSTTPTTTTTTSATTVDPKPARVSPMVRTNLAGGYDPHPYSDFPKCNPNYRSIPGGTIEEKCFS